MFSKTMQKTEGWLNELSSKMSFDDTKMAYDALKAVLHALRDRLPVESVAKFGAQLPMLVRGFYYEGWVPSHTPLRIHTEEEFIELVQNHLRLTQVKAENPEALISAVFQLIRVHMGESEIEKLKANLPKAIAHLFAKVSI